MTPVRPRILSDRGVDSDESEADFMRGEDKPGSFGREIANEAKVELKQKVAKLMKPRSRSAVASILGGWFILRNR